MLMPGGGSGTGGGGGGRPEGCDPGGASMPGGGGGGNGMPGMLVVGTGGASAKI